RRPHPDRKPGRARPVRHVLFLIGDFRRHRMFPRRIAAWVDAFEDAADQDRPPADLDAELFGQRLDVVKGEIGPGTGAVEEEFDHGVSFVIYITRIPRPFVIVARTDPMARPRSTKPSGMLNIVVPVLPPGIEAFSRMSYHGGRWLRRRPQLPATDGIGLLDRRPR